MESVEYLIIGAGIAGLSTAAHLVLEGSADALVIDRERQAGFYSSSHNAAIGRQLTGTDAHTALTVEGRNRLAEKGKVSMQRYFPVQNREYGIADIPGAKRGFEAETLYIRRPAPYLR